MTLKWSLGAVAGICSMTSIFLNLLIFMPVFRLAFIAKRSTVYIIAFFNVISDLCQLVVVGFYLAPSMMADRYVGTGEAANSASVFIGGFFIFAWYIECLVQVVMAVNRLVIITFKKYDLFTFRFTMLVFFLLILLTLSSAIAVQTILPCCVFICDHQVLSVRFIPQEGVYNYSNFVLVSYDIFSTVSSTVCYIAVFFTIRRAGAQVAANVSRDRSKQDVKYLLQFVFISIFYIFTWVFFEVLPHIVPNGEVEWYAIVPVLITLNCSSNSVIYLSVNKEVQKSLPIPWLRNQFNKSAVSSTAARTVDT